MQLANHLRYDQNRHSDYRLIDTNCKGKIAAEAIASMLVQHTDGIWSRSRGQHKYLDYIKLYFDETTGAVKLAIHRKGYYNWFKHKTDQQVKDWFAFRIKMCVKEEERSSDTKLWKRNCDTVLDNFGGTYAKALKASEVYAICDVLRGRKESFVTKHRVLSEAQHAKIEELKQKIVNLKRESSAITDEILKTIDALRFKNYDLQSLYATRQTEIQKKIDAINREVMD